MSNPEYRDPRQTPTAYPGHPTSPGDLVILLNLIDLERRVAEANEEIDALVRTKIGLTEAVEELDRQLSATRAELAEAQGWQPLETAPRDETTILVCDARTPGGFHQVVFWDAENKTGWHWATSDGPTFHQSAFTHWQPLPEPPEPAYLGT